MQTSSAFLRVQKLRGHAREIGTQRDTPDAGRIVLASLAITEH